MNVNNLCKLINKQYKIRWLLSVMLLIPIFWLPPMDLNKDLKSYSESPSYIININSPKAKLLIEEHKKAVDEISLRLAQGNDWFKWKFLIVGGVIMGAFTFVSLRQKINLEDPQDQSLNNLLTILFSSYYLLLVLALAVILSIIIDFHGRHNIIEINQLGLWIAYFVEPTFYGALSTESNCLNQLLGWEQFIRQGKGSLHTDIFSSIANWTLLHLLTVIVYGSYLVVLRQASQNELNTEYWFIKSSFVLVHISILAFAIFGHTIPGNFHFIVGESQHLTIIKMLLILIIILINIPEFCSHLETNRDNN